MPQHEICNILLYSAVPHEVESEDAQVRGVSCVASGEELYQAFPRRGVTPSGRYQFDVSKPDQQYYQIYTSFIRWFSTQPFWQRMQMALM